MIYYYLSIPSQVVLLPSAIYVPIHFLADDSVVLFPETVIKIMIKIMTL